jgi:hypothetical protein
MYRMYSMHILTSHFNIHFVILSQKPWLPIILLALDYLITILHAFSSTPVVSHVIHSSSSVILTTRVIFAD